MKYLDYPQFAELSRALTFTSSECTVFTRIEAYSCKPVAQEKRLYKHIQRIYAPEVAARKYGYALESHDDEDDDPNNISHDEHHHHQHHHRSTASPRIGFSINPSSSSIPPHLADSPFGNLTQSSTARKLLFTVIATLNAAFPDHDFADIPVSTFRREPSPAYVVHSLSSTLQSLRRNAAGNNPDAPAAAAAATSPTNPGTSAARSSTAFLSAAPRTFAGLPTSFDSSPTPFNATGSSSSSTGPSRGGIGSPSIAATLSPPGHLAQLSLSERAPPSTSFSASSAALASSTVPPAIDLPPPVSNAQSSTYPSHPRAAHDPTDQRHAPFSRSPISPRLAGTTSPRMGSASASAAISYPSPSHLPAAINAATHPALASILDDIMCVEECEVYSFHPDIEYDPHASADDDEERLLGAVGDGAGGGLGLFEEEVADDGGIDIGPANDGGGSDNSAYGRTARRWGPKGANAEGVYAYEHDDLEDIAEQFGEDEVEDDGDPMRPEQMARSLRAKERVTEAGRRAVNDDNDEEMGEADDALLFDEDVYGQGLSGTQTPRAPDHTQVRPDLSSDVSSSTLFSSSSSSSSANLDGDTSMGDSESLGRSVGQHSSPSKARVLGPADRSQLGAWGRPVSNATKDHDRFKDEDDEDDEDEFLSDADLYSDTSDRSAVVAAEKEDEDDAAGLLWATYAFFYNKRLKRVLFVSVWARTNAGVEAHAAAAAAAARARERVLRMSTSPRGGPSSSIGFGNSTSGQNISSSWPGPGGGKASSWSGMSPAQRAISASTQTSSGGAAGGGFAAKASRSSGTSPTHKKGGDPSKAATAGASSYSSSSSSSSSRKSSGRKESSLSKKTRREASAVGAVRGVTAAAAAATVGRRRRSSLGQSVITSMEAVEREGSTSRGTTPIATPIATSSTGATTIAAAAGTTTTSLTVPGGGAGAGEQSVAVSSLPAPLVVDALRGVPTSSSRNGTPPPPSARSPFPHASPRKPGDVPGAAASSTTTATAPVNVPGPRSQVGVATSTGEDTSFSIPSSWQSNTSSSPIPISSAMSGSNSNNSGGGGGGGRSFYGSMPSLDGAVLSARAGGGTPGTSGQVPVHRQFPKRVHPDQEGDSKRPRVDAE